LTPKKIHTHKYGTIHYADLNLLFSRVEVCAWIPEDRPYHSSNTILSPYWQSHAGLAARCDSIL